MKSLLEKLRVSFLLVPALVMGLGLAVPTVAYAATATVTCPNGGGTATSMAECGANSAQGTNTPTGIFTSSDGSTPIFTQVVNIMLFLVGAIAVIMLIYGGIRYVTSGGAQDQVTAAKNTIMYAIIGIIVAILAYALVNFVIGVLMPTS